MTEPFLGEIIMFGGNFAPRGWAFCDGQLLAISQNDALFSLLGTIYGGDGRTTFGLPDLRGRVPLHVGQGSGLTQRNIGSKGGAEGVTLNANQMPSHSHLLMASTNDATDTDPAAGKVLAKANPAIYGAAAPANNLNALSIGTNGGSQSHTNVMPYQTIHFCIALQGIYPSRN